MVDSAFSLQPKKAMRYWSNKLPMLRKDFNKLTSEMQDRAFVISRLTSLQQVQKVYDGIAKEGKYQPIHCSFKNGSKHKPQNSPRRRQMAGGSGK